MNSRNNPSHNKELLLPGNQGNVQQIQQLQMQAAMQERAAHEKIENVLVNTASRIYANLVTAMWSMSGEESPSPDDYAKLAQVAKEAVTPFGITFGMLKAPALPPEDMPIIPEEAPPAPAPSIE